MGEVGPIRRRAWHRATFVAAGAYNLAWGAWSAADPQGFFRLVGMEPLNHPEIYQALAMVVGLYGVAYLEVARRPERGWAIAAVGWLGKVLGPVGMAVALARGRWPLAAGVLCLGNDLIWLGPFTLYLVDAWPAYRRDWSASAPARATSAGPA